VKCWWRPPRASPGYRPCSSWAAGRIVVLRILLLVAPFLVHGQEAGNFTTCPVARNSCRPVPSRSVTVVRSRLAEAIWLAIARFQIRS
jgi:hypothetical protein